MGYHFLFACLVASASLFSPNIRGVPSEDLSQKLVTAPAADAVPDYYAGNLLVAAGIRGGVEEKDETCSSSVKHSYAEFRGTIRDALESVHSPNGSAYKWKQIDNALFIQMVSQEKSLLDVTINKFSFDAEDDPIRIQMSLFGLPEVRERAQELRLRERGPEIGFTQPHRKKPAKAPIRLEHITLRAALERITLTHKHQLIWTYWQYRCGQTSYSQFNWLSR
jgi:hypothetical protein